MIDKPMGFTRSLPPGPAATANKGLRGLSEYTRDLTEQPESASDSIVQLLPVSKLVDYQYNPRAVYQDNKIKEMADSIRAHGIINPVHVTPDDTRDGYYQVIAGRTRVKAITKYLKAIPSLQMIPAIVHKRKAAKELAVLAFMENENRSNHYDVDVGLYWSKLIKDNVFQSQADLAGAMGTTESRVSRMVSYAKLDESVLQIVLNNPERFSYNVAELLYKIQEKYGVQAAADYAEKTATLGCTIKQLQEFLKNGPKSITKKNKATKINIAESKNIRAVANFDGYGRVDFSLYILSENTKQEQILNALREMSVKLLSEFSDNDTSDPT